MKGIFSNKYLIKISYCWKILVKEKFIILKTDYTSEYMTFIGNRSISNVFDTYRLMKSNSAFYKKMHIVWILNRNGIFYEKFSKRESYYSRILLQKYENI